VRKLHRAATLVVGIQLLIWTATGFAFTWFDFARVRATGERAPAATLDASAVQVSIKDAIARAPGRVVGASLRARSGHPFWQVELEGRAPFLVDAVTGAPLDELTQSDAGAIARAALLGAPGIAAIERVASAPDLDGPLWRVRLDDAHATDVFVEPATGHVASVRNSTWRWFDRLWSLHVLGYVNRDNPAHWPLRVLGALALLVAITGIALWAMSLKRRRSPAVAAVAETGEAWRRAS
jgi:hypothetical protein